MFERKRIQCTIKNEFEYIDILQCFGWKLESRQEVYYSEQKIKNADIHSTYNGYHVDFNTETNEGNAVILIFIRDKNMKNYYKLLELEEEYERKGGFARLDVKGY